jgi:hypothetical protein
MQTQEKVTEQKGSKSNLRKAFEEVKNKKATRVVQLLYKTCCGCGCYDVYIRRVVDFDSPLQNGDRAKELLSTDTRWD